MERFENIELTEEEKEEALRLAREAKHYQIQKAMYFENISRPTDRLKFTAEQLFESFKQQFVVDEDNKVIVKQLCAYFANDTRFEKNDLKLNRGILLFGGVGVGKTTLLSLFRQNQAFSFRILSCREIERSFAEEGDVVVNKLSINYPIAVNSNPYGHQEVGYCFDDLGTETSVSKHYGKAKNVMAEILLNRYDNNLDFRSTHITTNLTVDELEQTYGTRVVDRMRQSFNIIAFNPQAKSRR